MKQIHKHINKTSYEHWQSQQTNQTSAEILNTSTYYEKGDKATRSVSTCQQTSYPGGSASHPVDDCNHRKHLRRQTCSCMLLMFCCCCSIGPVTVVPLFMSSSVAVSCCCHLFLSFIVVVGFAIDCCCPCCRCYPVVVVFVIVADVVFPPLMIF